MSRRAAAGADPVSWIAGARRSLARSRGRVREGRVRALVERASAEAERALGRDPRAAVAWAEAAVEVARPPGARTRAPWAVRRLLAKALHAAGDTVAALALLDELLAELPARDGRGRAELQGVRAAVLARVGRVSDSQRASSAARRAFLAEGDRVAAAQVDVNAANVLHRQDRHRTALDLYRRARRVLAAAGRQADVARCDLGLGNVLSYLGRDRAAAEALARAEAAFACLGAEHHRLVAAYNRHYLELLAGRAQAALEGLSEVRAGFLGVGDRRAAASCDLDIAEVHLHLHTFREAEEAARRAREAADELGMATEASRARLHGARALTARGAPAGEVAELLDRAAEGLGEEGNEVGVATAHLLRAERALAAGRPARAERLARAAARAFARHGVVSRRAAALAVQARALLAEDGPPSAGAPRRRARERARAVLEEAGRLARRAHWAAVDTRVLQARLDHWDGDTRSARRRIGAAVALVERLADRLADDRARTSFLSDFDGVFRDAIRYWLTGPRASLARAFSHAERARTFALVHGRRRTGAEVRSALRALALGEPARGTRGAAPPVPVAPASPAPWRGRLVAPMDLDAARAALAPEELLLELVTWPDGVEGPRAVAFAVTRDRADLVELPDADPGGPLHRLAAAAERTALVPAGGTAVAAALGEGVRRHAERIGELLLEPLRERLSGCRRLLVVPHGELVGLPFGLLPDPESGAPLGVRREVVHLPAASWIRRRVRARPGGRLLAIGAADRAAPHVGTELRRVARAARRRGTPVVLASGRRALRRTLTREAPRAAVIHFAGHGAFRWDSPERSSLRLHDGWIGVDEIEGLRLRADLTVLSACRGGAVQPGGSQFAGLVRCLLRAGSRCVLASPWTVRDELAADLFGRYHGLLAGGSTAGAALRRVHEEAWTSGQGWEPLFFGLFGAPSRGNG